MLPSSSQQFTNPSEVKATLEKVRETLELLVMDFYEFSLYKVQWNRKDVKKKTITPV